MEEKQPLGLPKGSVRSFLTVAMTIMTAALLFWGDKAIITGWLPMYALVVKDYFEKRQKEG